MREQHRLGPNTNQGYLVGDYISTSFTGDGKADPVFSLASRPTPARTAPATRTTPMPSVDDERELRHHAPAADAPVQTRREPIARGLHRHPEDAPLALLTAN